MRHKRQLDAAEAGELILNADFNGADFRVKRIYTIPGRSLDGRSQFSARPVSIVDQTHLIVELRPDGSSHSEMLWLSGFDFTDVLSADRNVPMDAWCIQLQHKEYTNLNGQTRRVEHYAPLPDNYLESLWKAYVVEHKDALKQESDNIRNARSPKETNPFEQPRSEKVR